MKLRRLYFFIPLYFTLFSCDIYNYFVSDSCFPEDLADDRAVYLSKEEFGMNGDGKQDDSAALQKAIDHVEDYYGYGVVFVPSGTYCIENTVNVWRGIRIIGYGNKRPLFVLKENTPGFQKTRKYMFHFRDKKFSGQSTEDGSNTTFYSSLINVKIRIENGNTEAAAVRFNTAQLSSLEHIEFNLLSGYCAVEQTGGYISSCHFLGGDYGLVTNHSASGWPVLMQSCYFNGQNVACVETSESGLTVDVCRFSNSPYAIVIANNQIDRICVTVAVVENISKSVFFISKYNDERNYIIAENIQCAQTGNFMIFRDRTAPVRVDVPVYTVDYMYHGLLINRVIGENYEKSIKTSYKFKTLEKISAVIPGRSKFSETRNWFNVMEYGAVGDGYTDDTIALQKAINDHKIVYLPMGEYLINRTLNLRKDTRLVGLHPNMTQLILRDNTKGFGNPDSLTAMLETPVKGKNVVSGVGFDTGYNRGAVQVKWQSGEDSQMRDVWFGWGGHGDHPRGEDAAFSLWVTNGGGGTFTNIWSTNVFTRAGLYISNTKTPGHIELYSAEHHNTCEVLLENVENWSFTALYTEENPGSENACAIDIFNCQNLNFKNLYFSRILPAGLRFPYAVRINSSENIVFKGVHNFSWGRLPFENTIYIEDANLNIREKDLAIFQY